MRTAYLDTWIGGWICLLFGGSQAFFHVVRHSNNNRNHLSVTRSHATKDLPSFRKEFRQRREPSSDLDFEGTIRRCHGTQDYQPAIDLAEKALHTVRPMTASLMTQIIKLFGEAGQLGRAISLLKVMQVEHNMKPNERHMGALIQACRKCGNYEMALALFAQMSSLGIPKNTIIYNIMISTLGEAVQWHAVLDVFGEMKQSGIPQDIITFSAAISACYKAGEWQHAITLYRLMDDEGIAPNIITLNAVLSACVSGRQLQLALEIFAEAGRKGLQVDTISYSVIIGLCGILQRFDLAKQFFIAMSDDEASAVLKDTTTETNSMPSVSVTRTVSTASSVNSSNDSNHDLSNNDSNSNSNNDNDSLIVSLDLEQRTLSSCRKVTRDLGCYNAIITACERCGKWQEAFALVTLMCNCDATDNQRVCPVPDVNTFSAALSCCGKAGRWHEALILFNLMETLGIRKDAAVYYTVISAVQSAAQSRRISEAKTRAWSESEGVTRGAAGSTVAASLTNGDTTKKPISLESKNAASVTTKLPDENAPASALFAQVQRLYAEGLANGFLQHWSSGEIDGVDGVNDVLVDGSTIAEQLVLTDHSSPPDSSVYHSLSDGDDDDDDDDVLKGESISPTSNDENQGDVGQNDVGGDHRDASSSPLSSTLSSPTILPPRLLDLHGFPLPVAKAAIDYMLKELYHEFGGHIGASVGGGSVDEEKKRKDNGDVKVVDFDVHVVTGRGKHVNNSGTRGVLRSEIKDYIKQAYGLSCYKVPGNVGCVIINHVALSRWIERQNHGKQEMKSKK